MKTIQRSVFIPGTNVLFFVKGVPHTGIVQAAYDNICEIREITFLNEYLDDPMWKIKTDELIKTKQFYLPKYPSAYQQVYVESIINQCYVDKSCELVYNERFSKLFPRKTLIESRIPTMLFGCDGFITLKNSDDFILVKDDPNVIYTSLDLFIDKDQHYIVLEKFDTMDSWALDQPCTVIIPEWKDKKHGDSKMLFSMVKDSVERHISSCELSSEIIEDHEFTEDSILSIWEPNERILEKSIVEDSLHSDHCPFIEKNEDGLQLVKRNLNQIY